MVQMRPCWRGAVLRWRPALPRTGRRDVRWGGWVAVCGAATGRGGVL